MNLVEQGLELFLEGLVFGTLVEFAHKVATGFEDVETEFKSGSAQILYRWHLVIFFYDNTVIAMTAHHTTSMVSETDTAGVHHPMIRVTKAPIPKSSSLNPGSGHVA